MRKRITEELWGQGVRRALGSLGQQERQGRAQGRRQQLRSVGSESGTQVSNLAIISLLSELSAGVSLTCKLHFSNAVTALPRLVLSSST